MDHACGADIRYSGRVPITPEYCRHSYKETSNHGSNIVSLSIQLSSICCFSYLIRSRTKIRLFPSDLCEIISPRLTKLRHPHIARFRKAVGPSMTFPCSGSRNYKLLSYPRPSFHKEIRKIKRRKIG